MWCPTASLTVWANAWLAGQAAPDDVLDALSQWAPRHSVTAYDAAAADATGLPWPDLNDAGAVSLLQTLRTATGSRSGPGPALSLALPVPGDVRGLPAGTTFARDAVAAGEAIVVSSTVGTPVGLVADLGYADDESDYSEPDFESAPELCTVSWTVYSLPAEPTPEHFDLGDAELALRSAVRSAADALGRLRAEGYGMGIDDPRGLIDQLVESTMAHRVPEHCPERAIRVLENATQVDAIITVGAGLMPAAMQSSSDAQCAGEALRPLEAVVRTARLAAVSAILDSAWR